MDITNVVNFIESRFRGTEISPAEIEPKIRAVVEALDIFEEPQGMKIRFSFGKPISADTTLYTPILDDWKEDYCKTLSELPDDVKDGKYTVYEIWYDSDDEFEELCGVEVMLYKK